MAVPRVVKQIIYGGFYLVFWAAVIAVVYFFVRPAGTCFDNRQNRGETGVDCGGQCLVCVLKNAEPIVISQPAQLVPLDVSTSGVLLQLKNPNQAVGADQFFYNLDFYDGAGDKIHSLTQESFIYAGQIKFLIVPVVPVAARQAVRTEAAIRNPVWKLAEEFPQPAVQSRSVKTEAGKDRIRVAGLVLNGGNSSLSRVEIGAILFDANSKILALSSTVIKDLRPFEERSFTIFAAIPAGKTINPNATQVVVDAKK